MFCTEFITLSPSSFDSLKFMWTVCCAVFFQFEHSGKFVSRIMPKCSFIQRFHLRSRVLYFVFQFSGYFPSKLLRLKNRSIRIHGRVAFVFWVLRWVRTCNITVFRNVASDWHETELRSELSSRASWRSSLRALHHGVPILLREPKPSWRKGGERSGRWWRVTLHVQTCSGHSRIILLMWRPNTDSAPTMPVKLPRN
jgi:hypothetical protein